MNLSMIEIQITGIGGIIVVRSPHHA